VLKNLLFIGVAGLLLLAFAAAAGEISLRLFSPQFSEIGFGYLEPSIKLRYRNRPDCRLRVKTDRFDGDFYTDSHGFRGKGGNLSQARKERVLFVGDSFTYGIGVRAQDLFSAVLQKRLDRMNRDVEVINAGVVGYGTDQEYLYIKDLLNRFTPDLIVINMYANDPPDNIWRALFYLQNGSLRENPSLVISATGRLKWWLEANSHLFIFLSKFLDREITKRGLWGDINPHLAILVAHSRILVDRFIEWPFYEKPHDFNSEHWHPLIEIHDFYSKKSGEENWHYAWTLEKKLVEEIRNFLNGKGIPCLFVLVPMKGQVVGQAPLFDAFQKNMIGIFKALDVPFLDLREQMAHRPELYLTHDGHWSIKGHALFADIMLEYLSKTTIGHHQPSILNRQRSRVDR